jgi:CRISPR-associated protein Csy1
MEPEDARSHYTERLELLPGLGTRYAMPRTDAQDARAAFGLPDDRTLYLVPQSLFKIHPDNDPLIAEIVARDPRGMAVFFAAHQDLVTDIFEARMAKAFEAHGEALGEKARFVMPTLPHGAYLRMNQLCDVMLDTLHWSGGNTSLDALASGLPVVTLPGRFMRGRQTLAMLRELDLEDLVAKDAKEFVDIAVRLGTDAQARRHASERILAAREAIFDRDEPVRAFNDLLERVYASFQP